MEVCFVPASDVVPPRGRVRKGLRDGLHGGVRGGLRPGLEPSVRGELAGRGAVGGSVALADSLGVICGFGVDRLAGGLHVPAWRRVVSVIVRHEVHDRQTLIGNSIEPVIAITTSYASSPSPRVCRYPRPVSTPIRYCSVVSPVPELCRHRVRGVLVRCRSAALGTTPGDAGDGAAQVSCLRCLGRRGRSSACRALWRAMNASRTSRTVARSVSSRNLVASKARRSAWSSGRRGSSPKTRASVVHDRATANRLSAERDGSDPPASYLRSWDTLTPARCANATWVRSRDRRSPASVSAKDMVSNVTGGWDWMNADSGGRTNRKDDDRREVAWATRRGWSSWSKPSESRFVPETAALLPTVRAVAIRSRWMTCAGRVAAARVDQPSWWRCSAGCR